MQLIVVEGLSSSYRVSKLHCANRLVGTDDIGEVAHVKLHHLISTGDEQLSRQPRVVTNGHDPLMKESVQTIGATHGTQVPQPDSVVVATRSHNGIPVRQTVHPVTMPVERIKLHLKARNES